MYVTKNCNFVKWNNQHSVRYGKLDKICGA